MRSPTTGALRIAALALACGLLVASRCQSGSVGDAWPDGALLVAQRDGLVAVLERFRRLDRTPLARWSADVLAALPACPLVAARAEHADGLWSGLHCSDPADPLQALRDGRDVAFALPLAGGRAIGFADVEPDGRVTLDATLPGALTGGALGLALPGARPPGEPVLSGSDTLLHARVRPANGLDLASLVPEGSQGAQMFRLKSRLFAGAVLDGVWELAVYLPEEGSAMPRIALAVGFDARAAAVAAMDAFVDELQQTWPVSRSPFRVDAGEGACLLDLKLLPDLAPCYVATESQLIVGWSPASVRKATDGGSGAFRSESALRARGGVVVDLSRFADADRILSRALSMRAATPAHGYPWSRVVASGSSAGGETQLRVRLSSAADDGRRGS